MHIHTFLKDDKRGVKSLVCVIKVDQVMAWISYMIGRIDRHFKSRQTLVLMTITGEHSLIRES